MFYVVLAQEVGLGTQIGCFSVVLGAIAFFIYGAFFGGPKQAERERQEEMAGRGKPRKKTSEDREQERLKELGRLRDIERKYNELRRNQEE